MKLKALLLALFTAGFAVSIAVAATPADKGKPKPGAAQASTTSTGTTTVEREKGEREKGDRQKGDRQKGEHQKGKRADRPQACRHARRLELHGDFVAAGAGGFAMTVKKGNRGAKALAGKQVSVLVDADTRFHGKKKQLADLVAGDRLMVQVSACKSDAAAGQPTTVALLARKVGVKGPKRSDGDKTTTGTTTTTTTTTATTTGTTTGS